MILDTLWKILFKRPYFSPQKNWTLSLLKCRSDMHAWFSPSPQISVCEEYFLLTLLLCELHVLDVLSLGNPLVTWDVESGLLLISNRPNFRPMMQREHADVSKRRDCEWCSNWSHLEISLMYTDPQPRLLLLHFRKQLCFHPNSVRGAVGHKDVEVILLLWILLLLGF